jgi:hypothetical protein
MLPKALTGLSAVAFVLAVAAIFKGPIMNLAPHTYGHACADLALIAIALVLTGDRTAAPAK